MADFLSFFSQTTEISFGQLAIFLFVFHFICWKILTSYLADRIASESLSEKAQREGTERNRAAHFPPCPIGWYAVCDSTELPPGKIIPFHCAGTDVAVWRGKSGQAHTIEAYCPHLGANIAYGHVKEDSAVCPFHLWCFDKEGKCTDIYYTSQKIPNQAHTVGYPTVDYAGRVWFYWNPVKPGAAPEFELPGMEEFEGRYSVSGIRRDINSHAWEILENCSDPIHFEVLHKQPWLVIPGLGNFAKVVHEKLTCEDEKWTLHFKEEPRVQMFGVWLPNCVTVHTRFIGLTCHIFEFTLKGLGKATMVKSITQITPTVAKERDIWFVDRKIPRFFIWYLQGQGRIAFDEDFIAWEHKIFLRKPLPVKGDGLITKRRRWSRQFYPHSQTQMFSEKESEDW